MLTIIRLLFGAAIIIVSMYYFYCPFHKELDKTSVWQREYVETLDHESSQVRLRTKNGKLIAVNDIPAFQQAINQQNESGDATLLGVNLEYGYTKQAAYKVGGKYYVLTFKNRDAIANINLDNLKRLVDDATWHLHGEEAQEFDDRRAIIWFGHEIVAHATNVGLIPTMLLWTSLVLIVSAMGLLFSLLSCRAWEGAGVVFVCLLIGAAPFFWFFWDLGFLLWNPGSVVIALGLAFCFGRKWPKAIIKIASEIENQKET